MSHPPSFYDCIVIGGGFYGSFLASERARHGQKVLLLESESQLMQRASLHNQARVHGGYHYPRHFLTAVRSQINFSRFTQDYSDCIVRDFESYYAIASRFSKTTAKQFSQIMIRAGAPIEQAPDRIRKLFNPILIEDVFTVKEFAFDAILLKKKMEERLRESGVQVETNAFATRVTSGSNLQVEWTQSEQKHISHAPEVMNCSYSGINRLLRASSQSSIPLKHEISEMCLVEAPEEFRDKALTVMCGPFFSLVPFPSRGLHSLSHVRYTPHLSWMETTESGNATYVNPDDVFRAYPRKSHFMHMQRDSSRYAPCFENLKYKDSLWEIKTVLSSTEQNDGRPILYQKNPNLPGLVNVMGGKIDNIYDVSADSFR